MYSQDNHTSTTGSTTAATSGSQAGSTIGPTANPHTCPPETPPTRARLLLRWVLVAAMAAFIFYMSSRTSGQLGSGTLGQIKEQLNGWVNALLGREGDTMSIVAHFCEYLVLGALLANALRSHWPLVWACVAAVVGASIYGVTDEFHQLFVAGRYCDVWDWVTDTCGAGLGALLLGLFTTWLGRK